jgi:hypothetical protein
MSDQMSPRDRSTGPGQPTASGVAAGFILFAVILMIMIGVFQALSGLVAILNNALYRYRLLPVAAQQAHLGLDRPDRRPARGLRRLGGVLGPDVGSGGGDHSGFAQCYR